MAAWIDGKCMDLLSKWSSISKGNSDRKNRKEKNDYRAHVMTEKETWWENNWLPVNIKINTLQVTVSTWSHLHQLDNQGFHKIVHISDRSIKNFIWPNSF